MNGWSLAIFAVCFVAGQVTGTVVAERYVIPALDRWLNRRAARKGAT